MRESSMNLPKEGVWGTALFIPEITNGRASKKYVSQWESSMNLPGEGVRGTALWSLSQADEGKGEACPSKK